MPQYFFGSKTFITSFFSCHMSLESCFWRVQNHVMLWNAHRMVILLPFRLYFLTMALPLLPIQMVVLLPICCHHRFLFLALLLHQCHIHFSIWELLPTWITKATFFFPYLLMISTYNGKWGSFASNFLKLDSTLYHSLPTTCISLYCFIVFGKL